MSPRTKAEAYSYAEEVCNWLPRRLQEVRERRRKSQYLLAQESGVSRGMIGRIEANESVPTVHVLSKLAFALDVRVERLFKGL